MEMKQIFIEGAPVGKGRPRFTRRGNRIITYTPDKTREYEDRVQSEWVMKYGTNGGFGDAAVCLYVMAYMPVPSSAPKREKTIMLNDTRLPTVKPDWDNIGKIVADALNGIAYNDDSQIVEAHVYKRYSEHPGVSIMLTNVKTKPRYVWNGNEIDNIGVFDKETIERDVTVQILENSVTGDVSVGWYLDDGDE